MPADLDLTLDVRRVTVDVDPGHESQHFFAVCLETGHVRVSLLLCSLFVGHGSHSGHEPPRSAPPRTRPVFVVKIRSTWPDAMQFADVLAKRTSVERSLGYARKINELANHDPGLGDWVATTKYNRKCFFNYSPGTEIYCLI